MIMTSLLQINSYFTLILEIQIAHLLRSTSDVWFLLFTQRCVGIICPLDWRAHF